MGESYENFELRKKGEPFFPWFRDNFINAMKFYSSMLFLLLIVCVVINALFFSSDSSEIDLPTVPQVTQEQIEEYLDQGSFDAQEDLNAKIEQDARERQYQLECEIRGDYCP